MVAYINIQRQTVREREKNEFLDRFLYERWAEVIYKNGIIYEQQFLRFIASVHAALIVSECLFDEVFSKLNAFTCVPNVCADAQYNEWSRKEKFICIIHIIAKYKHWLKWFPASNQNKWTHIPEKNHKKWQKIIGH